MFDFFEAYRSMHGGLLDQKIALDEQLCSKIDYNYTIIMTHHHYPMCFYNWCYTHNFRSINKQI